MKNLLAPILGLAILVTSAPIIHAGEHDERVEREHCEEDHDFEDEDFEEHEEKIQILDRNIRLEFKLLPLEEHDRGVYVITASPWYATRVEFSGEEMEVAFAATGRIETIADDEFFLSYEVSVRFAGDEEEAEFHVESSARLKVGQAVDAASMGEKTLVIRATYADAPAAE
jgi:hypothetical protein